MAFLLEGAMARLGIELRQRTVSAGEMGAARRDVQKMVTAQTASMPATSGYETAQLRHTAALAASVSVW